MTAETTCAICGEAIRYSRLIDRWSHVGPFLSPHHTPHTPTPKLEDDGVSGFLTQAIRDGLA